MQDDAPERRHLEREFKKEVALEAILGQKTPQKIADERHVQLAQVYAWKKMALEGMDAAFQRGGRKNEIDKLRKEVEELRRLVSQREYELVWLQQKIPGSNPPSNKEKARLLDDDPHISRSRQCELVGIKRTTSYYKPHKKPVDAALAQALRELHDLDPSLGYRKLPGMLKELYGIESSEDKVRRTRRKLGLKPR